VHFLGVHVEGTPLMKVKFQDSGFSFQRLRVLGIASSRQADVGEALATANRIVDGDFAIACRRPMRHPDLPRRNCGTLRPGFVMATERTGRSARETPFVGRDIELDGLSSVLRTSMRGKPRVVAVSGEVGVGKTRLLREFGALARQSDVDVTYGRAIEDSSVPYLPLTSVLRARAPAALVGLVEGARLESASIAPTTATVGGDTQHHRLAAFITVTEEVLALARQRPTVIVLDDLHWADSSSIELIGHLVLAAADAADGEQLPLLFVLAHRPVASDHRLAKVLERFRRESLSDTFPLEGLGSNETATIVRALETAPASNQLIAAVQTVTQGYPLFIQEFFEQLRADGLLERAEGYTTIRPAGLGTWSARDIGDTVSQRIKALGREDVRFLALAALMGDAFSVAGIARVAGLDTAVVGERIARAQDQRVLVGDGEEYRFRHPLLRQTLIGSVAIADRRAMHLQIANALATDAGETSGTAITDAAGPATNSVAIADHLLAAGPAADPADVIRRAREGAHHAFSAFAWAEAARLYAGAADAAEAAGQMTDSARGELHFLAGLAYQHDFDIGPSLARYERAMRTFEGAGDFAGQAQTLRHRTRIRHITTGTTNYGDTIDLGPHEKVLAALGDESPVIRGLLLEVMSQVCWTTRDSAQAEALARRALELGDRVGDEHLRHYATFSLALAQYQAGRPDEARRSYQASLAAAQRAGNPWIENPPLQRLSLLEYSCGHLDEAERLARRGRELAERVGYAAEASYACANLATIAVARGQYETAEELGREAVTLTRRTRYPWGGVIGLLALTSARMQRGRFADARHALKLLQTPGEVLDKPGASIQFIVTVAEDLIRVTENPGQPLPEVKRRVSFLGPMLIAGPLDANATAAMCILLEIAAAVGALEPARAVHARLAHLFDAGLTMTSGGVLALPRVLALGSVLLGDRAGAARYFDAAEEAAQKSGARPELGRASLDRAVFLLTGDESDKRRAGERAVLARAIFEELGMRPYVEQTTRVMEMCGLAIPAPPPPGGPGDLDAREVELLARVARGRTPQDIARDQLRAAETVAAEIERLFVKIDVSSPALAAAYAFGQGIVGPASAPPPGRLVLVVTDMVGFTSFVERVGDARAQTTIHMHNRTIRFQLARHRGKEVTHTGDGLMLSFSTGDAAIACAIAIQRQFAQYSAEHPGDTIHVRIGMNAGRVFPEENRLFGAALNVAVRVCSHANAGQVLVSASVLEMTSDTVAVSARELGTFALKGFAKPIVIYEMPWSV
jgi:class 3 adenylate cyclase/tetratricopeptide (TPR) repeat protein